MRSSRTSLFSERDIHSDTNRLERGITQEIDGWDENKALNVIEADVVVNFSNRYKLTPPVIHFDEILNDIQKGRESSNTQFVGLMGGNILSSAAPITVVALTIPVTGNIDLLKIEPSEFSIRYPYAEFGESEITIYIQVNGDDVVQAREQIDAEVKKLRSGIEALAVDFEKWNNRIEGIVVSRLQHRKEQIQRSNEFHDSLGISILEKK